MYALIVPVMVCAAAVADPVGTQDRACTLLSSIQRGNVSGRASDDAQQGAAGELLQSYEVAVGSAVIQTPHELVARIRGARTACPRDIRLRARTQPIVFRWFRTTREEIHELPLIELVTLPDSLVYLRWRQCTEDTAVELARRLRQVRALRGVIVDLRGNPGGDLAAGLFFVDLWLPKDTVMLLLRGEPKRHTAPPEMVFSSRFPRIWTCPVAVIADRLTASTAEAVVGMFKRMGAVVVGEATAGDAIACLTFRSDTTAKPQRVQARIVIPGIPEYQNCGIPPDHVIRGPADDATTTCDTTAVTSTSGTAGGDPGEFRPDAYVLQAVEQVLQKGREQGNEVD